MNHTLKEWKKIARLLKQVYAEIEKEAMSKGISTISEEYEELINRARLVVLEKNGWTLEEYRTLKEQIEGVDKAGTLDALKENKKKIKEVDEKFDNKFDELHIPDEDEISEIAERVAKKYIVPPIVKHEIVKEIEKPKIIETTRIINTPYDDTKINKKLNEIKSTIEELKIPEPYDDTELKEYFHNYFSEQFKHNIDTLGMPDFRKLAMGLQSQIDNLNPSWSSLTGTPTALLLDQTTPQTVSGGVPIFDDGWQSNKWYRNGYGTTLEILTGRDTAFTVLATSTTDGGALTNVTNNLNRGTATATTILNTNAYRFWVGNSTTFNTIGMWITTVAVGINLVVEYWDGSNWTAVSGLSDGTSNLTAAGTITFTTPGDWATLDKGDGSGAVYWLKIRSTTSSSPDCQVNLVQPISYTANDLFQFKPNSNDTSTTNGIWVSTLGKLAIPRITGDVAIEGATSIGGALTVTGTISSSSNISGAALNGSSSTITIANTDNYYTGASFTSTPGAATGITAALIPTRIASPIRILSTAWDIDGAVSENQNWYMTAIPYAGNTPSSRFVMTQNKGTFGGQDHELMTISEDGTLTMLGDTLGSEVFTNGAFTSGTSWNVTGQFALTSDTAKFTAAAGALTGTLYQASTDYATALKPYRWYKFTYTTSAINTTCRAYIGSEVLEEERRYLSGVMVTAGTYSVYFKTNSSPGNFTIYADGAAASDSVTFDDVSLKEVVSGNIIASGKFTGGGTNGLTIDQTGLATFDSNVNVKSFTTTLTQATANVDLTTAHHTLEITANTFTQALPTASGIQGRIYVIKNSGTGTITLDGNGSETIDGATTITLSQYDSVTVQSNGTNWIII